MSHHQYCRARRDFTVAFVHAMQHQGDPRVEKMSLSKDKTAKPGVGKSELSGNSVEFML
jgi:hypothetical protein